MVIKIMNKTTQKQVLTMATLSIATGLVAGFMVIGFQDQAMGGGFSTPCGDGSGTAKHFDKIIFHTEIAGLKSPGQVNYAPGTMMDVKVQDFENEVAILTEKASNHLNILGWSHLNGSPVNAKFIVIDDVEYAIICENFNPV